MRLPLARLINTAGQTTRKKYSQEHARMCTTSARRDSFHSSAQNTIERRKGRRPRIRSQKRSRFGNGKLEARYAAETPSWFMSSCIRLACIAMPPYGGTCGPINNTSRRYGFDPSLFFIYEAPLTFRKILRPFLVHCSGDDCHQYLNRLRSGCCSSRRRVYGFCGQSSCPQSDLARDSRSDASITSMAKSISDRVLISGGMILTLTLDR